MAKYETRIKGDFNSIVKLVEKGILDGSISATLEDSSDFYSLNQSRCAVRVFERYSYTGGNRLTMSVTFFEPEKGDVFISAITSGGSQALFFKINTIGENAFIEKIKEILP